MRLDKILRQRWPEVLLVTTLTLPWVALLALGSLWLWQHGHVWVWASAAAALSLLAWPLARLARRRSNAQTRTELDDRAEPSREWNVREREAWPDVLAIADNTTPFSFTEIDPLLEAARKVIEAVAHRLHPETHTPWAQFTVPELLLVTERVSRELRRDALRFPFIREWKFGSVLWFKHMVDRYEPVWTVGYSLWRVARFWNPAAAVGREISRALDDRFASILVDRLRARATQAFVLEVGHAAIDLYSGRLALSEEELRLAQERDAASTAVAVAPVRILLAGQVNAGKSSLLNALAQEVRSAVGPLPTTSDAAEYSLDVEGQPSITIVDMPGLDDDRAPPSGLLAQAARADLVMWVASATQPARAIDRKALDEFRAWAQAQLARRPPPLILALTHVDELRPASEWAPPYDISAPERPKARAMRAAMDAVARALGVPMDAIVPVAIPPAQAPYNIDALWARIAAELDEAKLVQLDRLRLGGGGLKLRELAEQLGNAGRFIMRGLIQSG